MALGFGFNKAKSLSTAEKCVQQGKIQNAINEYEKLAKHDPRDLTILNTLGDLHARLGQLDLAAANFKRVGEAYAADGFTVKAIAIYKKVAKITPGALDTIQRLAELYTQQNLLSDARQLYLQVADSHMKSGNLDSAVGIFHKLLESDPENAAIQTRLAELYIRMGKKDEAQEIFFRCAESLQKRGAISAADEALSRVLSISPGNTRALMMRAQVAIANGDAQAAIRYLEVIPNLDSSAEGLTALLRARLIQGQATEAEPLARKLMVVHNDTRGVLGFAEWLISTGECEAALKIYAEYSDRLLSSDGESLLKSLRSATERIKENAPSLEILLNLLQKANDQTQISEVMELLAHALVQQNEFARARDLYRSLAAREPENPVHQQNYRQMVARLGEDSALRSLSPQEAGQAFMVDELEVVATPLEQQYEPAVSDALTAALTEAELLESYTLLPKAIAVLEAGLPLAPQSVRLNQQLASLYARTEEYEKAAQRCDSLAALYQEAKHAAQASEYSELARRYRERAGTPGPVSAPDSTPQVQIEVSAGAASEVVPEAENDSSDSATFEVQALELTIESSPPSLEIDISDEWHSAAIGTPTPVDSESNPVSLAQDAEATIEPLEPESSPTDELLEEIRFYIGQQMWEEAASAAAKCEKITPGLAELTELNHRILAGSQQPASDDFAGPVLSEFATDSNPEVAAQPLPEPPAPSPVSVSENLIQGLAAGLEESLGEEFALGKSEEQEKAAAAPYPTPATPPLEQPQEIHQATDSVPAAESVPMPGDVLTEMFAEFKEVAEQENQQGEDPENHYNLGIAFREMGLLDEAIGEFQKVARGLDQRPVFRESLQVYTLLGQCFIEKGIPEAAVPWYEKALTSASDSGARVAVHYELGSAHQAAGSRQAALRHFLEVYGNNIDYRDVAERIKALRT